MLLSQREEGCSSWCNSEVTEVSEKWCALLDDLCWSICHAAAMLGQSLRRLSLRFL